MLLTRLKQTELTSSPILAWYNPTADIKLVADTSAPWVRNCTPAEA